MISLASFVELGTNDEYKIAIACIADITAEKNGLVDSLAIEDREIKSLEEELLRLFQERKNPDTKYNSESNERMAEIGADIASICRRIQGKVEKLEELEHDCRKHKAFVAQYKVKPQ